MGKVPASFGGNWTASPAGPARQFAVKVRWAIAAMVMLLVFLVSCVIYLVNDMQSTDQVAQAAPAPAPVAAPPPPEIPTIRVLVPASDIQEGDQLTQALFHEMRIPAEFTPAGIITTDDALKIEGKFARDPMPTGELVSLRSLSTNRPVSALSIPAGHRAVTVLADAQTSVEGFVRPGSLVDVLWVYKDELDAAKRIATIVRFVRVLSVAGDTFTGNQRTDVSKGGSFTVTLLATEKDAKVIQLAAAMGQVSLSLVGESENPNASAEAGPTADIVTMNDVLKKEKSAPRPRVTSKDPVTGKEQIYINKDGDWILAEPEKTASH